MTFDNKKRPSNDDSEFMPVTKRLNLLSIDNSRESTSDSSTFSARDDENSLNSFELAQQLNQQHLQQQQNVAQQLYLDDLYPTNYNPSLTSSQNPIYYEANRILFEAHQLRLTRMQKVRS